MIPQSPSAESVEPHASSRTIVYDLSELLTGSFRIKYYGIARVVAEIGIELFKLSPSIRFVVFSPGHSKFFEIFPKIDSGAYGGVDLGIPPTPVKIRLFSNTSNVFRDSVSFLLRPLVSFVNRSRWKKSKLSLTEIDIKGASIVSAARPKLMLPMLESLNKQGLYYSFYPLLHDVIPLRDYNHHLAKGFPIRFLGDTLFVIEHSAALIAISKFSGNDIAQFCNFCIKSILKKVFVIPLAHECREGIESPELKIPEVPFFLMVGAQFGKKNLEVVLEAFLKLCSCHEMVPHLVLAGARHWHVDMRLKHSKYSPIRDKIIYAVNPNQTDLIRLYKAASALILASHIEGWGLPAAEALWLGTPVICSDIPVMHEVCGESALYFDPDDPLALAQHIENCLRGERPPPKPRRELRTWQTVARDLLDVICR